MSSTATRIDTDCKLLLHCNGVDGSTTFADSELNTPKTVTAVGNAQIDTAQSKFGGASGLFDGVGDYLTVPDSADWALGSTWTIDGWFRFNAAGGRLFGQIVGAGNYSYVSNEGGALFLNINGTPYANGTFNPTLNTWYHLAFVNNGGTLYIFIDGTQNSTQGSVPSWADYAAPFAVGDVGDGVVTHNGWVDEFRVVKGTAVWTANFTPPTSEYVGMSNSNFFSMF